MKKLIVLPILALLLTGGVFSLGQHSKSAHAAGPVVQQTAEKSTVETTSGKSSEQKGTESDGPGGHQDTQGGSVNHNFQGAE